MYIVSIFILVVYFMLNQHAISAEIYKWVDESGVVHYGECPPADCVSEQVELAPGPSDDDKRRAHERMERLIERAEKRQDAVTTDAQLRTQEVRKDMEISCYSSPAYIIGPVRADHSRPISKRTLSKAENRQLLQMFKSFRGRWSGSIDEIRCLGNENDPYAEIYHYDVDSTITHDQDGVLIIESEVDGLDTRTRETQVHWLNYYNDLLHFGDREGINYTAPQWEVEIISISKDSLMFMRKFRMSGRRATSLQHLELRSIHLSRRSASIMEWFYIQGALARLRRWDLRKWP